MRAYENLASKTVSSSLIKKYKIQNILMIVLFFLSAAVVAAINKRGVLPDDFKEYDVINEFFLGTLGGSALYFIFNTVRFFQLKDFLQDFQLDILASGDISEQDVKKEEAFYYNETVYFGNDVEKSKTFTLRANFIPSILLAALCILCYTKLDEPLFKITVLSSLFCVLLYITAWSLYTDMTLFNLKNGNEKKFNFKKMFITYFFTDDEVKTSPDNKQEVSYFFNEIFSLLFYIAYRLLLLQATFMFKNNYVIMLGKLHYGSFEIISTILDLLIGYRQLLFNISLYAVPGFIIVFVLFKILLSKPKIRKIIRNWVKAEIEEFKDTFKFLQNKGG
jgi:hypothetical protein